MCQIELEVNKREKGREKERKRWRRKKGGVKKENDHGSPKREKIVL